MTTFNAPAVQVGYSFMCRGSSVFTGMTFGHVYQVVDVSDYTVEWLDDSGDIRSASTDLFHAEFKMGGFAAGDTVTCIKTPEDFDFSYVDTYVGQDYKIRSVSDFEDGYIAWVDSVGDFPEDTIENFIKYFKLVARMGDPVVPPTAVSYEAKPPVQPEAKPVDMALSLIVLAMQSRGIEITTTQSESLMDVMTVYARGLTK